MNEEKKRFNVIDVLIILGILLIVLALIFRAQIINVFNDTGSRTECRITIIADEIAADTVASIKEGDQVTWLDRDVSIGSIESISSEKATVYVPNYDGSYSPVVSDTLYKLTCTIVTTCLSDNGCYIDGKYFVAKGMTMLLSTQNAQFTVTITAVEY